MPRTLPVLALVLTALAGAAPARAQSGPVVAVVDSGVDVRHAALRGHVWVNPAEVAGNGVDDDGNGIADDVHGADFVDGDGAPADPRGHGTHVACLAALEGARLNRPTRARIMALRVLDRSGSGSSAALAQAIDYATAHGARVINLSLAYFADVPVLRAALARAAAAGVLVVAAAGNGGENLDRQPIYPASYRLENMLVVAASLGSRLAPWSARGAHAVDVAAPGGETRSCLPGGRYGWRSGTSQATALVTRAAARLLAARPDRTAASVRAAILGGTTPHRSLRSAVSSGGRLNIGLALRKLI